MPKKSSKPSAKRPTKKSLTAEQRKEKALAAFTEQMREIAKLAGPDAFRDLAVKFGLDHEDHLRKSDPDNPMLELIDDWRAEQQKSK